MKTKVSLLVGALALASTLAIATAQEKDPLEPLLFLLGGWSGEGDGSYGPYTYEVDIIRRGNWLVAQTAVLPSGDPNQRFLTTSLFGFDDRGKMVNHAFDDNGVLVAKGRLEEGGLSLFSRGGGVERTTRITKGEDGSIQFDGEVHLEYTSRGEPRNLVFHSTMHHRTVDDNGATAGVSLEDEVKEAFATYAAEVNAGNWKATLGHYADDRRFYWVEAGRVTYESKQQVVDALEAAYTRLENVRFETSNVKVTALSEMLAVLTADFEQTLKFADNEPRTLTGVLTTVVQKGADGWQFLVGHSSTLAGEDD